MYSEPNPLPFIPQPIRGVPDAAGSSAINQSSPDLHLHQLAETSLDDRQEPGADLVVLQTSESMKRTQGDVQPTVDASAVQPTLHYQPSEDDIQVDEPSVAHNRFQMEMEPAAESCAPPGEIGMGPSLTDDAKSADCSAQTNSSASPLGSREHLQSSGENPHVPLALVGNSGERVEQLIYPQNFDGVVPRQCSEEASEVRDTNTRTVDRIASPLEVEFTPAIFRQGDEDFEMAPATPTAVASVTVAPIPHALVDKYSDSDSDVSFS